MTAKDKKSIDLTMPVLILGIGYTENPREYCVYVGDMGVPDLRIKAKGRISAMKVLKEYIYNELEGHDDITDGKVNDV